ncbi:MAG: amidohydrolase family protein [Pseudomonadota bacterium]
MTEPLFDAHFHIIDPRFPLVSNQGYLPPAFPIEAYRREAETLCITGGALVTASFQGFDQAYLLDALPALGPSFVGVCQIAPETSDEEILSLHTAGVRALRFNLRRGTAASLDEIERLARRASDLAGWHAEFYLDAALLEEIGPTLRALPQVVIDHLGLSQAGLPQLLRLAEGGAKVKATGFGRVDLDLETALPALAAANPTALMFGSDLPSTRAPRPFDPDDIALIRRVLSPTEAQAALHDNAFALYCGQAASSR